MNRVSIAAAAARCAETALVAACRRDPESLESLAHEGLADAPARLTFLDLAARHHVVGLALAALEKVPPLDPGLLAEENRLRQAARRRAAYFGLKRDRVLAILSEAGLSPVVLKGGVLAEAIYSNPAHRDLDDLDVLVAAADVRAAFHALSGIGYTAPYPTGRMRSYLRHHHHVPMRDEAGHYVEIHWALAPPTSPFRLAPSTVVAHATTWESGPGRPPIRGPSLSHALLHVVIQNIQERFTRLGRLVDIDRVIHSGRPIDWDELLTAARASRLEAATALSFQLTRTILDTEVGDPCLRHLALSRPARCHLALMRPVRSFVGGPLAGVASAKQLLDFWLLPPGIERIRLLPRVIRGEAMGEATSRPMRLAGLVRLVKLAVFQGFVYAAAATSLATRRGRRGLRFWSRESASSAATRRRRVKT